MHTIYTKKYLCLFALLLLTACESNPVKDEQSVFYAVPVGSMLTLNQQVTISGDKVAIYVQDSEILRYREVDKYRPNCKFEIYTISEQPRNVQPDRFEIIKVVDEIETSALQKDMMFASVDFLARGGIQAMGMLDHSLVFNYATMMYLRSDKQTDVYRMTCQHWEAVADDKHLSIAQMRQAMGDIFTLKIKE